MNKTTALMMSNKIFYTETSCSRLFNLGPNMYNSTRAIDEMLSSHMIQKQIYNSCIVNNTHVKYRASRINCDQTFLITAHQCVTCKHASSRWLGWASDEIPRRTWKDRVDLFAPSQNNPSESQLRSVILQITNCVHDNW